MFQLYIKMLKVLILCFLASLALAADSTPAEDSTATASQPEASHDVATTDKPSSLSGFPSKWFEETWI